jgi:hypothetical protein
MTRTSPTEYIKLTGTKLRETEKAVHFTVVSVNDEPLEESVTHWFPISQIKSMTYYAPNAQDIIQVADWICKSKELI